MATEVLAPKKPKKIKALGIAQGVDDHLPFSSPFHPSNSGLTRLPSEQKLFEVANRIEGAPTIRQLTTMRRLDGQARSLFRLLTLPIRAALKSSTILAAEGGEKERQFIDDAFNLPPTQGGMTVTFHRFIEYLLVALFEGTSVFEKVFWIPKFGPLKGKITLKKLAHRPADTIRFIADDHGGFAGFRQQTNFAGKAIDVYVPPEYAFYYAAQETERRFYGVSFFESAFPHYDAKVRLYYTAHLAAQRAAVGTRVGTAPPAASKAAKLEFQQALANLSVAQWIMAPDGFKVEVMKEGGAYDFLGMINHHNHMMAQSMLAGFMDKDTGGGKNETGSLVNFAQPGDDMFILMLRAIMEDIEEHINHHIIPQLIDYNFNGAKYPTFKWGKLTDEQRAAIAQTFDKLATAGSGLLASSEFLRALEKNVAEDMGLEIDWEEVETREAEEKAKQEAMEMGLVPGQGAIDPATGLPMPGAPADPAAAIPEGAEEEVESLDDVVALLVAKAEMDAGVADAEGANVDPNAAPAGPGQAGDPNTSDPTKPKKQKRKTPGEKLQQFGLSADMMDWADRMIQLTREDYQDG
jgi:hypothetical protein